MQQSSHQDGATAPARSQRAIALMDFLLGRGCGGDKFPERLRRRWATQWSGSAFYPAVVSWALLP